jgi:hypothetical protein
MRETAPAVTAHEQAEHQTDPAAPVADPSVAQVLMLQRSAGNVAVSRMLAERSLLARQHKPSEQGPIPPIDKQADDLRVIDPAGRDRLEKETHSRVNQAFSAFQMAALAHQDALKAEAKAEAEIVAAAIDILTGFAAPAFAAFAGAKLSARAAEKMTEAASKEKVVALISTSDTLKASFTGATKAATATIKLKSSALFGETDADQFAKSLRTTFHAGAQSLTDSIGGMKDDALLAVWCAYDFDYTNEDVYRAALVTLFKQFKEFVRPVGHEDLSVGGVEGFGESIFQDRKAVYMDAYGQVRLALVRLTTTKGIFTDGSELTFDKWVPDKIAPWVVSKSEQKFGKVETIDPKKLTGHLPAP